MSDAKTCGTVTCPRCEGAVTTTAGCSCVHAAPASTDVEAAWERWRNAHNRAVLKMEPVVDESTAVRAYGLAVAARENARAEDIAKDAGERLAGMDTDLRGERLRADALAEKLQTVRVWADARQNDCIAREILAILDAGKVDEGKG